MELWNEYLRGVNYNRRMGLYEQVRRNENFYLGRQWEGIEASEMNKPVINVLKRVVSYFISMIVSDDVAVALSPHLPDDRSQLHARILEEQIRCVTEQADIKAKCREIIRNAAVDGEGYLYLHFDPDMPTGQAARGGISAEVVESTNVLFGNPYSHVLQKQPYIMIVMRCTPESLRREAEEFGGEAELIRPDADSESFDISGSQQEGLCTAVLKLWREGGRIHCVKFTRDCIVRPAWSTGYTRYPLAAMCWERIKNSYHGMAAVTAAIPNQISINQLFAMAVHSVKNTAFPKVIYDRTKLRSWTSKVGQAIGVVGNPHDAIAGSFRAADMSPQVTELIERLCQKTLEFMGASDAALGNIAPNNTSAIIATQKASAMPLELQRMEFYRFTEEYVRVMLDMIRADYGVRRVSYEQGDERVVCEYDLGAFDPCELALNVDIGAAAYWSEVMQVQTLDNLFNKGIIPDALSYLENVPAGYLRGKHRLIERIKGK